MRPNGLGFALQSNAYRKGYATFRSRLKEARRFAGLTQADVAALLHGVFGCGPLCAETITIRHYHNVPTRYTRTLYRFFGHQTGEYVRERVLDPWPVDDVLREVPWDCERRDKPRYQN